VINAKYCIVKRSLEDSDMDFVCKAFGEEEIINNALNYMSHSNEKSIWNLFSKKSELFCLGCRYGTFLSERAEE